MNLHTALKKEIKRVGLGSLICLVAMLSAFFLLSVMGTVRFDYSVLVGGILGTGVAMLNFTALCITIQKVTQLPDKKQMQARLQWSYNGRLLLQGAWVVAAFSIPWVHAVAGAIPLLFPSLVIFLLKRR